jgi:hypothetical protein
MMNSTSLRFLALIGLSLLLSACSTLLSGFDKTKPVHIHGGDIGCAKTPPGFVVTVREVYAVKPFEKYASNIYADSENYYISSAIQKLTPSGDNSWLAKRDGIKIRGKDRSDIEALHRAGSGTRGFHFNLRRHETLKVLGQERR